MAIGMRFVTLLKFLDHICIALDRPCQLCSYLARNTETIVSIYTYYVKTYTIAWCLYPYIRTSEIVLQAQTRAKSAIL